MLNDLIDVEAVNERLEKALTKERKRIYLGLFLANLIVYVVFMLMAWVFIPLVSGPQIFITDALLATLIMLSVGWGTGALLHGIATASAMGAMDKALRERVTAREFQREIQRLGLEALAAAKEKPKRSHERLMLSEDGELLDITEDDNMTARQRG